MRLAQLAAVAALALASSPAAAQCRPVEETAFLDIGETARISDGQVLIRFNGIKGDLVDAAFGGGGQQVRVSSNIAGLDGFYPLRGRAQDETFATFADRASACPGREVSGSCAVQRITAAARPKLVCRVTVR